VGAFGGYVRSSSVSSGEPRHGEEPVHDSEAPRGGASFDIRVPSVKLSDAIASLANLGHVRSENNTTNDVSDQHAALRSSSAEAQAERSSLLARLRKATAEGEMATLKARLAALDARIAQLQRQLRALDQRVTYTSLALSLTPEAAAGSTSGELTPGGAAHDAAGILGAALAVIVLAAATLLPLGAVVVAGWVLIVITRRRLREQALDAS
jgi:Flp pilus assembly protein TadB